jgi:hypothetical protein
MTTEEQRKWVKTQMHGFEIIINKENKKDLKEEIVYKYSNKTKGYLRESVIISGIPYFIRYGQNVKKDKDYLLCEPKIEEGIKTLRPPYEVECPYTPYEFASNEEPNQYLQRALKETPDTLIAKIKTMIKLVNEIDNNTATLLSATIFNSYFQDRFSTVYYIIVVGANGTGKSAFGETFECLGYRAVKQNNATPAFWFRVFGTNEAGQVTIVAEEVDKMDENGEVMGMLKEGYQPNSKVPRMSNDNSKMEFFYPFSFKIMIGEKSPGEDKARGLLDRSFKTKSYKGYPDFDIKDIRNPQGNPERQKHLDAFNDLRKLLLAYRIVHFKDPYKELDIGLDGRDKELCKPTLQLFYTLGASKELLEEIAKTLQHFLDIKNKRKGETLEAVTYPIIINLVSKHGNEIFSGQIWQEITGSLEGQIDDKKPNLWDSADFGRKYRNTVIKMICDKFGAEISHTEKGNNLIFDPNYLKKMEKIYRNDIKIKPIDDPDALTHLTHSDGTRSLLDDNKENQEENQDNARSSRQSASDESVNQDKEVKCPYCDYVEHPFYLKIHRKNAHEGGL